MHTLAIDPGPELSGVAILKEQMLIACANLDNEILLTELRSGEGFTQHVTSCAVEEYKPFAQIVGQKSGKPPRAVVSPQTAETLRFIGRIEEAMLYRDCERVEFVSRVDVLKYVTGSGSRVKSDTRLRERLIDIFGKEYLRRMGCTKHAWSALGVGYTANRYEVPF